MFIVINLCTLINYNGMGFLKDSFKNMSRFKASTFLNIVGLTVAFASFIIIMIQVRYDLSFDKHYPESERIFELQVSDFPGRDFSPFVTRLFADQSISISPEIETGAYVLYLAEIPVYVSEKGKKEQMLETGGITSPLIHSVFGFKCIAGNFDDYSYPNRVMMSRDAALRFFGNENPIGRKISVNQTTDLIPAELEVVAVYDNLPENSSIPNGILISVGDMFAGDKAAANFRTFMKTTTTHTAELEQLLDTAAPDLLYYPSTDPDHRFVRLNSIHDSYFLGADARLPKGNKVTVYSLMAVGILIILIAIVNFINFSMSLIPRKMRTINTKKVLGSNNSRLWLQQLFDAIILTVVAFSLSVALVYALSLTPFAELLKTGISLSNHISLLFITFALAIFTGIAAVIYPALYSTSFSPALVLKGSFGLSAKGRKLRTSLVGLQYLISITLIIAALFIQVQYEWMRNYDIGVNKKDVVKINLSETLAGKRQTIEHRMKDIAGINEVAFCLSDLFSTNMNWNREINGETVTFAAQLVTSNFLSMMDIRITEGRGFEESDNQGKGVLIFNETARQRFGLSLAEKVWSLEGECPIIGFCEDFNYQPLIYPIEPLALYVFGEKDPPWPLSTVYVKANSAHLTETIAGIRGTLLDLDPEYSKFLDIQFLDDSIGGLYDEEKNLASLVTLFSLLAIMISTLGVLGLIMFETQYRRKEIGVRKVFGATVAEILRMFNKRYVKIVFVCFIFAIPLAYYIIKNWQSNFAYPAPIAAWIFCAALLITLLITVSAVTIQSYSTAIENPVDSIETE